MRTIGKNIDWNHYQEKAAGMTDEQLWYAAYDCYQTAKNWDHAEHEHEARKAGQYRDEGSVYTAERTARTKAAAKDAKKAAAAKARGTLEDLL